MWTTIIGAALGAILGALATITAARINAGKDVTVARLPPYDQLAARISVLEVQVGNLRSQVEDLEDRDLRWRRAWDDLQARWTWWATQPTPPPYPIADADDDGPPTLSRRDDM